MKLATLNTDIVLSASVPSGTITGGTTVTFDTNVPALLLWTFDGSKPTRGRSGTAFGDAPADIVITDTTNLRIQAIETRPGRYRHKTPILEYNYTVQRKNTPSEQFKNKSRYYILLKDEIVDHNFYVEEGWTVPVSTIPFSYLAFNPESRTVKMRVLHNGVDLAPSFPTVGPNGVLEVLIYPVSGENLIEIQTN